MTASTFDPSQYKEQDREGWNRVAAGWRRWWATFERSAQTVCDRLLELGEVGPGGSVLDLATGIGEPALTAARRVGAAGRVVAVDVSPGMLAIARERAAELGAANVEFREMDADALELDGPFDAALSRWGLMFVTDLDRTLQAVRGALASGGRIAAAVWGPIERVPCIGVRVRVVARLLDEPPAPAGRPGAFALGDPALLSQALEHAGFEEIEIERRAVTFDFASPEEYASFHRDVAGPRIRSLAALSENARAEFWRAVADEARPYARDGRVRMINEVICVAACNRAG